VNSDVPIGSILSNASYVLFVLVLFWGIQVLRAVGYATIAGVVGGWWFGHPRGQSPVAASAKRAVTLSLGSLAFGSLIISALQALRWAVERARRRQQVDAAASAVQASGLGRAAQIISFPGANGCSGILASLGDCLLRLVTRLAEYGSVYAYSLVGIYGA
jgi:hypothetical protein